MKKIFLIGFFAFLLFLFGFIYWDQKEEVLEEEVKIGEKKMETKTSKLSLTTIYDNYQFNPELKTGWGFSCLVKTKEKNILFDTGADSLTLLSNIKKMGIDLKEIDLIVLSHIHGDHVWGLEGVLNENRDVTVFIPASFPDSMREMIESYGAKYKDIKEAEKISEGVWVTGELGALIKEQSLIINSAKGLIIITGCAHPGIVNIIEKTKEIFPNENVHLVLGGFHLTGASDLELRNIISNFRKLGVQIAAPCHCSGDRARELFKEEYKEDFIENGVGQIIEI
jgi:7,8-dihydropterin-6-yl-methyl-4-(beta-D-ribofuranosyl)aminobenzene 5'-phosphate synthase